MLYKCGTSRWKHVGNTFLSYILDSFCILYGFKRCVHLGTLHESVQICSSKTFWIRIFARRMSLSFGYFVVCVIKKCVFLLRYSVIKCLGLGAATVSDIEKNEIWRFLKIPNALWADGLISSLQLTCFTRNFFAG